MEMAQTVHVVDDDEAVRFSLQFLLESSICRTQTYATATELLNTPLPPAGCILTDFRMPDMNGLQLQAQLTKSGIRLPVILMTGYADVPVAVRAMKAGAVDFLEKPFAEEELLSAIRKALSDNRRVLEAAATADQASHLIAGLTPREREVFDLLVIGQSNKEMARILGTSPRTIDVHRARVFHKLNVDTLPDLVRLAMAAGAAAAPS